MNMLKETTKSKRRGLEGYRKGMPQASPFFIAFATLRRRDRTGSATKLRSNVSVSFA